MTNSSELKTNKSMLSKTFVFFNRIKYLILVVFTSGFYSYMQSIRTMPFAEGWYTYYAQCINSGEVVYRDFDYLFTPLYIYLIAFITKIFGYKIIVLRMLGVIIFCVITAVIYLIMRELFSDKIAVVASLTAAFYLQSEVVQVFYDYVRLMDIFSCLTALFLLKAVKNIDDEKLSRKYYFIAGITNSVFALIKQNMGLLFFVYAFLLVIAVYLVLHKDFKTILKGEAAFLLGMIIPIALTVIIMAINGSLIPFFNQTGSDAIAAKGGIMAILFRWFPANKDMFLNGKKFMLGTFLFISGCYFVSKKYGKDKETIIDKLYPIGFIIGILVGFIAFNYKPGYPFKFINHKLLSQYNVFLIITAFFGLLVLHAIYMAIKKKKISNMELMIISVAGSYFAISYGCGMSAGLAQGQAGIGVALCVGLLLHNLRFKFADLFKVVILAVCLCVTMQSIGYKMAFTYGWWGMGESPYWDCVHYADGIEVLEGIKLSAPAKNAYEEIYTVITEHTDKDDPIYCFPQIPIFYTICDRHDPGVRAKVQWFDVASDSSIDQDMQTIRENPPKAILIYLTNEGTYEAHEAMFRGGQESATRRMREFLFEYANENGYTYYGEIVSTDSNHFALYYLEE